MTLRPPPPVALPHPAHSRRAFLSVMAAGAALLGVRRLSAEKIQASGDPPAGGFTEITLTVEDGKGAPRRAVVYLRDPESARERRALILLHGYGQAASEQRALAAWRRDYALLDSYAWLANPPLLAPQRARFVSEPRVAELNAELSGRPMGDMMYICPVTPVPYYKGRRETLERFADFVEERLLPEVRRLAPIAALGLVGVSMGGQVGLELLARKPGLFRTFTGILTAIEVAQVTGYANRIEAALAGSNSVPFYVLSAESDLYRVANERLFRELQTRGLEVHYRCPPGIHTDTWLREVGCAEMLLWQDRTLGEQATAR